MKSNFKYLAFLVLLSPSLVVAKEKYNLDQAGYFAEICEEKSSVALCSAYLAGYRKGLNDMATHADQAAEMIEENCKKDGRLCKLPPGGTAISSFEGCNLQAMKLSNATVKNMLLDYLRKNPEAKNGQLVDAYAEAMWQVFPCD